MTATCTAYSLARNGRARNRFFGGYSATTVWGYRSSKKTSPCVFPRVA
jgi:hypothetical protein